MGMEMRDNVVVCVCIYIGWDYYSDDFAHITWIVTGLALLDG